MIPRGVSTRVPFRQWRIVSFRPSGRLVLSSTARSGGRTMEEFFSTIRSDTVHERARSTCYFRTPSTWSAMDALDQVAANISTVADALFFSYETLQGGRVFASSKAPSKVNREFEGTRTDPEVVSDSR